MGSTNDHPSLSQRLPGSVNVSVAEPPAVAGSADPDAATIAQDTVKAINTYIAQKDIKGLVNLFSKDGYWRDHLALSWSFTTLHGHDDIAEFLNKTAAADGRLKLNELNLDKTSAARSPQNSFLDATATIPCVMFCFTARTPVGTAHGVIRLIEVASDDWKIYTLFTSLVELHGHEENIFQRRPHGVEHGAHFYRKNWAERRQSEAKFDGNSPQVLILGAGQGGLTIAARLKALGIETLIIDQNSRIGDNWRRRYHQLVLHDPVWYDHLPYFKFPPQWPVFTPKDKLAGFFESYATLLELNVWMRSTIVESKWDPERWRWTVTVKRQTESGAEGTRTFYPHHIIQATGHSGKMNMPEIKGIQTFKGDRLCHSSQFPGARNIGGKKAVVIGCCNSAHDIAQDYMEKGYDITVVQRSSTCVVSSDSITNLALKGLYEENGPDVEDADLILHSLPMPVFKTHQIGLYKLQKANDAEILQGLAAAGFKTDDGPDDAGLMLKYYQRGGGYYIDVGASKLIADGRIKIKQGQEVSEVLPHGIQFADGSELEADEIVFATGYQNMRTQTRAIFGDNVADAMGDVWGFNDKNEVRMMWQRTGHPGFWFHGGNLALCRYYSRLLALQIKGLEEGIYKHDDI